MPIREVQNDPFSLNKWEYCNSKPIADRKIEKTQNVDIIRLEFSLERVSKVTELNVTLYAFSV